MNYRNILLSASVIAFVSALVFGGTQAFFSDEETSEGNVFAAGAIDLLVDSEQHYAGMVCVNEGTLEDPNFRWQEESQDSSTRPDLVGQPCTGTWAETDLGPEHTFFDFTDLKPGDEGENTISLHVIDNDAYMCAIVDNMQTQDNGCNEPELGAEEDAYGDGQETCGDPGEGEGELQEEIHFFAWTDDGETDGFQNDGDTGEGDNIWQEGEDILFENVSGPASDVIDGVVYPLYTPENGAITGSTTNYIGLYWCYGEVSTDGGELSCDGASASNITQTDSLSADITFYAEQARNNEDFQCPTLEEEPERPLVGALQAAYIDPEQDQNDACDFTVSGDDLIQTEIGNASDGDTICVDSTYNGGDSFPVHVNKEVKIAGLGAKGDANIPGGFFVDASNVTVTGLEFTDFTSGIQSSGNAAVYIHNEAGQGTGDALTGTVISHNIFTAPAGAKGDDAKAIMTEIGSGSVFANAIEVMHNEITGWNQGMFFNTANADVHHNDIIDNNVGIANDGPDGTSIHHNDFEDNDSEAVGVNPSATAGASTDGVLTVNTNNLAPASIGNDVNWYGADTFTDEDVDATGNWWDGEAAGDRTNDETEVDVTSPEASAFPEN